MPVSENHKCPMCDGPADGLYGGCCGPDCQAKARLKRELKDRAARPEYYLERYGVPRRYLSCSFDNYAPATESQRKAMERLASLDRLEDSVLMHGPAGCGKTHLGCALLRHLMPKYRRSEYDIDPDGPGGGGQTRRVVKTPIRFISAPEALLEIRSTFGSSQDVSEKAVVAEFHENALLFIDDIGVEKPSEWATQTLYSIVDGRYCRELPTIFTSNLSLDQIAVRVGDRLASRLAAGVVLHVDGPDHRLGKQ